MVSSFGITTDYGNGNNVEEVTKKVKIAKEKILNDEGPQFLEFDTYRWREHCGPNYDNDIGYRSENEFLDWKKRDPIKLFRNILIKEDPTNKKKLDKIKNTGQLEVNNAFDFAEKSPFPSSNKAFESMFK